MPILREIYENAHELSGSIKKRKKSKKNKTARGANNETVISNSNNHSKALIPSIIEEYRGVKN